MNNQFFKDCHDAFNDRATKLGETPNIGATWHSFPARWEGTHYALVKHEEDVYVEFHVEIGNATRRKQIVDALRAKFPNRDFWYHTYYTDSIWQTRTPVINAGDVTADVKKIEDIVENVKIDGGASKAQTQPDVGIRTETLAGLLTENLFIPNYQRAYCWRAVNILDMLEDIRIWMMDHKGTDEYHLGTILLKKCEDKNGYDIIDGQQRLTTFALLSKLLESKELSKLSNPENGVHFTLQETQTDSAKQYLLRARNTLNTWIQTHGKECIAFERIRFSVVILAENTPDDLAYTFFSNTNSAGKRLSDYDLLKTHHLRYIQDETSATKMVERWHLLEKEGKQGELLHLLLYRLRMWRGGERLVLGADSTPNRTLFRHYAADVEPFPGMFIQRNQVRMDSILSGGAEFFNYVEFFRKQLAEFGNKDIIKSLSRTFIGHSNGVLLAGMKALAFLFYCRFGEFYLAEAVCCIAYRISILRNNQQVRGGALSNESIFAECVSRLDRVTSESEFLAWMNNSKCSYIVTNTGETAKCYWGALGGFLTEHPNGPNCEISKYMLNVSQKKEHE